MGKVVWTHLAIKDLEEIEDFIAQDSRIYAINTIEKILSRVALLIRHPKSGRVVPEFENQTIRELIEGNYRIVYFIADSGEINILRVHHSARILK